LNRRSTIRCTRRRSTLNSAADDPVDVVQPELQDADAEADRQRGHSARGDGLERGRQPSQASQATPVLRKKTPDSALHHSAFCPVVRPPLAST
jgi:hypothetical protein